MPLTKKLRQTYLDRAKHELGVKGGLVVDDNFFLISKHKCYQLYDSPWFSPIFH